MNNYHEPLATLPPSHAAVNGSELLQLVMMSDTEAVDNLLITLIKIKPTTYHQFILQAAAGTESHNGRPWEAISPIEFAAWAGDLSDKPTKGYMLNTLLNHLPIEHKHRAIKQLERLKDQGTRQFGQTRTLFSPLQKLDECYANYDANFKQRTSSENDHYWHTNVGGAQKNLPVYVLQELCRPIPWKPMPNFANLYAPPRVATLAGGSHLLPLSKSGLGTTSALYHFGWSGGEASSQSRGMTATFNRDVLRELADIRYKQLEHLIEQQWQEVKQYREALA